MPSQCKLRSQLGASAQAPMAAHKSGGGDLVLKAPSKALTLALLFCSLALQPAESVPQLTASVRLCLRPPK